MSNKKIADDYAPYLFHQGTNYNAYDYLGSHIENGGVMFRVWAPRAKEVSVIGEFNHWSFAENPMKRITEAGIWECFIHGVGEFAAYKYAIIGADDRRVDKADPYAVHSETRPKTASKVYEIEDCYRWGDSKWLKKRAKTSIYNSPVNIYELNAASWKKHWDGNFYSYDDLAAHLIDYIKEMGYTHVEFMPLTEFPFDMSWGYQVSGYFAANSRFGTPNELMKLIDRLHRADIGVIMDWVPAHFPKDEFALSMFDGSFCYEYDDHTKRENPDWGTHQFDYGKTEVESFLVSAANFWFDRYHIDGLRVDAVAAMLYLDYSREHGEWNPNGYGGNANLEAVALFKKLNAHLFGAFPGIMMIAEESTSWPGVTHPVHDGGLGFNFKWNMGWMNDSLRYFETPTIYRKYHHDLITNTYLYAFSENYILPISHDEVVHGKGSLINKMPGDYWQKFANLRLFLCYMITYPGKKLLFMGSEFGQFNEWNYADQLEWGHLTHESHRQTGDFCKELNNLYRTLPELHKNDGVYGFKWLNYEDGDNQILTYIRTDGFEEEVLVLLNMSPTVHHGYIMSVPKAGSYVEIFNSDDAKYMGSGVYNTVQKSYKYEMHGYKSAISVSVPPLACVMFKRRTRKKVKSEE